MENICIYQPGGISPPRQSHGGKRIPAPAELEREMYPRRRGIKDPPEAEKYPQSPSWKSPREDVSQRRVIPAPSKAGGGERRLIIVSLNMIGQKTLAVRNLTGV